MTTSGDGNAQRYIRVSDIVKEHQKMLMPIRGFEKMPLVSLEEAIVPLVSILPEIQDFAYVAKQRCDPVPADGLTKDQSASIILYSMDWEPQEECLYFSLNSALRTENRQQLKPWFLYLKLILTGLARIPPKRDVVYRGVKMDLSVQYPPGKEFVWWGFSSCSANMGVLKNEQFLGKEGERSLFTIDCESGKDISRHSYYQSEEEILLIAARQFVVKSCVEPAPGLHIIQIKEMESPITLLKPVIVDLDTTDPFSEAKPDQPAGIEKDPVEKNSSVSNDASLGSKKESNKATAKTAGIKTNEKADPTASVPAQKSHEVHTTAAKTSQNSGHTTFTGPVTSPPQQNINKVNTASKPPTGLLDKIASWLSITREFAKPGVYKELDCKGRHCARCGKCRDWHYAGDDSSWEWVQTMTIWEDADWNFWRDHRVYERFKKRGGARCRLLDHLSLLRREDYYSDRGIGLTCLCEDNIQNGS